MWVNDASAYTPIGTHSHRPLATVDVFELLRVICRQSPILILISVLFVLGLLVVTDRCVFLMFNVSRNYFDDDTSTVRRRSHRTFLTDLIFIDDVSMAL